MFEQFVNADFLFLCKFLVFCRESRELFRNLSEIAIFLRIRQSLETCAVFNHEDSSDLDFHQVIVKTK